MAIDVESDGHLVVVDTLLDGVVRVDPVSGDRTIVADNAVGAGPGIETGLSISRTGDGILVVTDTVLDAVLMVDPVSGDRTILSKF